MTQIIEQKVIHARVRWIFYKHRRRINTEWQVKVVAAGWGLYLNAALTNIFGKHPFWEGGDLVWCEPDDHTIFKASIPPSSRYSIYPFLRIILVNK